MSAPDDLVSTPPLGLAQFGLAQGGLAQMGLTWPTAFQWILLVAIAGLIATTVKLRRRAVFGPVGAAVAIVVLLVGGMFVSAPELTSLIARGLGIQRGADLLLYCTVLVAVGGFMAAYARIRRLRTEITALTREMALINASRGVDARAEPTARDE